MRYPDWPERLWSAIDAARGTPFQFGRFDCVRFAASCHAAIVIDSQMPAYVQNLYRDRREALRLIMRTGLEDLVTVALGAPRGRASARRGDLLAIDTERGPAIGVCTGERIAVASLQGGVGFVDLAQGLCAWAVD